MRRQFSAAIALMIVVGGAHAGSTPQASSESLSNSVWIAEMQGRVEVKFQGSEKWLTPGTNQVLRAYDRVHTGPGSRVAIFWSGDSVVSFGASTELEILPPDDPGAQHGLSLSRGILSFFHRGQPNRIRVVTRGAVAGIQGTEFVVSVDDSDQTTLSVVDGAVKLSNEQSSLLLTNGQQAIVELGKAPRRTPGFIANNLLQWCFYYPAVIAPEDLELLDRERSELGDSLASYRSGGLLCALEMYPAQLGNLSDDGRLYKAALLLSVGEVDQAEADLLRISDVSGRLGQLASALRQLIAAVKRQSFETGAEPQTASECLARSYLEQSRAIRTTSLQRALHYAERATVLAPEFGFAWQRVAELELGFGRVPEAVAALDKGLTLAPKNAQALATKGFILASRDEPELARTWFDRALAADSALGNAWLGRGLVRLKQGDELGGREDLLIAAATEPQRAELRSYLGKAYYHTGDDFRAIKELDLAKRLDPNDPTAWLYSALLNQQNNRVNDAIRDLEQSQALNDNRAVYRSGFLLGQDQAVRSANLASIYRDAGMVEVGEHEATRAVSADYANYSAHLFLAGTYADLREAGQNNSRYETAAASEFLLANLLSPASAGTLTAGMSQQEHFMAFDGNRVGVISDTMYLSRGAWYQMGMQYGIFNDFSYDFQAGYTADPGQYANNDLESRFLSLKSKWQLTPDDSVFAQIYDYRSESGDLVQRFAPSAPGSLDARFHEEQAPTILAGFHHQWSPGMHTLLFASRVEDDFSFAGRVPVIEADRFANNTSDPFELVTVIGGNTIHAELFNHLTLYSAEIQQICVGEASTSIIGSRYQYGFIDTINLGDSPLNDVSKFQSPPVNQSISPSLKRFSLYGYHQWSVADSLQILGGLSYDCMVAPENVLSTPISGLSEAESQLSPKVGGIWHPAKDTALRFGYTQSIGSQNLDQSQRIEPVQVVGFVQSTRSIIGEPSVAQSGPNQNESFGFALEQRLGRGTFLGVTSELLKSRIRQTVGAFDGLWDINEFLVPSGFRQNLTYQEESLLITGNQLIGRDWSLGGQYRISHAKLDERYPEVYDGVDLVSFQGQRELEATLHFVNLFAVFNHPSGFFAKASGHWYDQSNSGYSSAGFGDEFWQFDAFAGFRFSRRTAELTLGVLNLTDQNYQLNPLNAFARIPQDRTLMVRLQINF